MLLSLDRHKISTADINHHFNTFH